MKWKKSGNHANFDSFSENNPKTLYFQKFLEQNPNIQETIDMPIPKSGLRDTGDPSLSSGGKSRGGKSAKKKSPKNDNVAGAIRNLEASNEQRLAVSEQRHTEQMGLKLQQMALKGEHLALKKAGHTMKMKANTKNELKAVSDRIGVLVAKKRAAKRDLKELKLEESSGSQNTQDSSLGDMEDQLKRIRSEIASAKHQFDTLTAKIAGWEKEEEMASEEAKNKENSTEARIRAAASVKRAAARATASSERATAPAADSDERAAVRIDTAHLETDDDEDDLFASPVARTGKLLKDFLDNDDDEDSDLDTSS